MEQMQGLDAAFIALEQRNSPMHIGSVLIYDPSTAPGGFVRYKDILDFVGGRVKLSKTMRQTMMPVPFNLDFPYWYNDPDFDLEYHIRHLALPKPGDWRQLWIQAARIFARPLDLTRPPWEFTVVEGLDNLDGVPKGSYALVTKVHHAAIDGLSGIDILNATHTLEPTKEVPNDPDPFVPDRVPSQASMLARGYFRGLLNPIRQAQVAGRSVPGVVRAARGFIKRDFDFSSMLKTPRTRFNKKLSPHRVVETAQFDLGSIKAIRKLVDGPKVNDVMLAIVGGGMRRYLQAKGELPESTVTAMAPVSVRDESEKGAMGNQVSAMMVPLGSHIEDPLDRIRFVYGETVKSKAMSNALGARQMTEMSKAMPNLYTGLAARLYSQFGLANAIKPMFNTVVTNVPGPPIPIYSTGAELKKMFGLLCLFDGVGLGHVVHSYRDEMNIAFTACREAMPDPAFYAECLQKSYDEYVALLGEPAAKPKPAKRKVAAKKKTAAKKKAAPKRKVAAKRKSAPKRKTTTKRKTPAKVKTASKANGDGRSHAEEAAKPASA